MSFDATPARGTSARLPPDIAYLEELAGHDIDVFLELYDLYSKVFPMPDEREPPAAFRRILDLNRDVAVQARFGPYREIVATVRRWRGGPVIGGHIFGVTSSSEHRSHGIPASVQAIYTFLHADNRGEVPIHRFVAYCEQAALDTFPMPASSARPIIFFEVNNPLKMTAEELDEDLKYSGIGAYRRYMFWFRSGFRPLELPYVQPRLRPDAEPVRCLDMFCSKDVGASVPARVVEQHLHAFTSVSVLKGADAYDDPEFAEMARWLRQRDEVRLLQSDSPTLREVVRLARAAAA